jgi:hypothetical protein
LNSHLPTCQFFCLRFWEDVKHKIFSHDNIFSFSYVLGRYVWEREREREREREFSDDDNGFL